MRVRRVTVAELAEATAAAFATSERVLVIFVGEIEGMLCGVFVWGPTQHTCTLTSQISEERIPTVKRAVAALVGCAREVVISFNVTTVACVERVVDVVASRAREPGCTISQKHPLRALVHDAIEGEDHKNQSLKRPRADPTGEDLEVQVGDGPDGLEGRQRARASGDDTVVAADPAPPQADADPASAADHPSRATGSDSESNESSDEDAPVSARPRLAARLQVCRCFCCSSGLLTSHCR